MKHPIHAPQHIPDLLLERYRLGELPPAESERIRRCLETDPELHQRLQTIELSEQEISRRYPSDLLAAGVRHRLQQKTRSLSLPATHLVGNWRWKLALVSALVMLGIGWPWLSSFLLQPTGRTTDPIPLMDRLKGDRLIVYRKTKEGSELLSNGDRVQPGDQIRLGYRAAGRSFGMIVSIDGRGVVTRHLPQQGDRAARLTPDAQVLLDYAYELDDTPSWERFYLVTGRQEFEIAPILEAARTAARSTGRYIPGILSLPTTLDQSSIVLMKETTR